jgi:hypothetical protein
VAICLCQRSKPHRAVVCLRGRSTQHVPSFVFAGNADAVSYRASRRIGWPHTRYFAAGFPRGLARRLGVGSILPAWATLPTDGLLQIQCLDRLPDPFIVTVGSSPLDARNARIPRFGARRARASRAYAPANGRSATVGRRAPAGRQNAKLDASPCPSLNFSLRQSKLSQFV